MLGGIVLSKKLFMPVAIAMLAVSAHAAKAIVSEEPDFVDGCYQISTAGQLYGFAEIVNGTFGNLTGYSGLRDSTACGKLTADIVVNENVLGTDGTLNTADTAEFAPWIQIHHFMGSFDGLGHTISGLYFNSTDHDQVALFSSAGSYSENADTMEVSIKNVRLVDTYFHASNNVAGILGMDAYYGKVSIDRCSFDGVIEGESQVGGLVGWGYRNLSITNSFNEGRLNAEAYVGGIMALLIGTNISIVNVYNVGPVSGDDYVGGIVGIISGDNARLVNVFNAGPVNGTSSNSRGVGAVAGSASKYVIERGTIDNAFSLAPGIDSIGISMTEEKFANGTVVTLMRNYSYEGIDGLVWGQDIGSDPLPKLTGVVTGDVALPTITLSLDTGSSEPWTKEILAGYKFRIPNIDRENYKLLAWYTKENCEGESVTHVPATQTTDVKYWGHYERVYRVTLETNGGKVDSLGIDSYVRTVGAKLPRAVSRTGYVFAGWYAEEDFSGDAVDAITEVDEGDKVFYAKWLQAKVPEMGGNECYVISNAEELYGFAAIVNGADGFTRQQDACAVLSQDIVVNRNVLDDEGNLNEAGIAGYIPWNPIDSFEGTFDGQMHTISGLYYNDPKDHDKKKDVGLFGAVGGEKGSPVVIENLGLVDSYFASDARSVGGIVARVLEYRTIWASYYAEIRNVYSTSTLETSDSTLSVAGIVGHVDRDAYLHIENCYNQGAIRGYRNYMSGLVGYSGLSDKIVMVNCYNAKPVSYVVNSSTVSQLIAYSPQLEGIVEIVNSVYMDSSKRELGGILAPRTRFTDGTVAEILREGVNGEIWGQNVGVDSFPLFSGKIQNSGAIRYNVTFYTFDEDTTTFFNQYWAGVETKLPQAQREGMWFMGWYDNAMLGGDRVSYIKESDEGDLKFYAKWELKTFSVRILINNPDGGRITGLKSGSWYTYGELVSVTVEPFEGFYLNYWSDLKGETEQPLVREFYVDRDMTITVYFGKYSSSSSSEPQSSSSVTPPSSSSAQSSSSVTPQSSSSVTPQSSSSAKSSSSVTPQSSSSSTSVSTSSSSLKSSSSSAPKSSSSSRHSGLDPESSSSKGDGGSSSAMTSSSAKSSSSKAPKSSSSCKNCVGMGLPEIASAPLFNVEVAGRTIQVAGAQGSQYALLDMQGRVIRRGAVDGANFSIPVSRGGNYLVRIGDRVRRVSVK